MSLVFSFPEIEWVDEPFLCASLHVCQLASLCSCLIALSILSRFGGNKPYHLQICILNVNEQTPPIIDECNVTGEVRLAGAASSSEGRVEICINGVWGSVASFRWTTKETNVVCGQLGYSNICKYNVFVDENMDQQNQLDGWVGELVDGWLDGWMDV